MKKDTTELILDYVIRINTELLKTNARIGDLEVDVKGIHQEINGVHTEINGLHQENKGMREEIKGLRQEMRDGFEKIGGDIKEINMKLDWMGEVVFVQHENRLKKLEGALA